MTTTLPRALLEQALGERDRFQAELAARRAALAQQAEPDAYGYASRLAVAIWEKHYKDTAPHWKPLDDLVGVLTQIDNMAAGLTRLAQQAEPVEPVAWSHNLIDNIITHRPADIDRHPDRWTPLCKCADTPPQRKPLTDEEIDRATAQARDALLDHIYEYGTAAEGVLERIRKLCRAVERAHGIKE